MIPNHLEEEALRNLSSDLKNFESVSLALQEEGIDLLVARRLFDALMDKYPEMERYLSPTASIVHSPAFESGVCKLLQGKEILDSDEEQALCKFKKDGVERGDENQSFAQSVLKKSKLLCRRYQDLDHIPPTSNRAERFFSSAKLIVSDIRKSMLPKNLEMLLFLKFNRKMWDEKLLSEVYNEERCNSHIINIDQ